MMPDRVPYDDPPLGTPGALDAEGNSTPGLALVAGRQKSLQTGLQAGKPATVSRKARGVYGR
jgi:hypothetical protein